MPKHVLLSTAGHLSSCPRLIKEAKLLSLNGYKVSIVYLESISWITHKDKIIINEHNDWDFYPIKWKFNFQCLVSKFLYFFYYFFKSNSDYIQGTSWLLNKKIKSIKADLYIAHHPSLISGVAFASEHFNSKFIYDVEDAFPFVRQGSTLTNFDSSVFNIERKFIPKASMLSVASPLYIDLYKSLYELKVEPIILLNVFDLIQETNVSGFKDRVDLNKVSFYWMSQTVGLDRGLQDLFQVLDNLDPNLFELHIRGNCSNKVKQELLSFVKNESISKNIYFHDLLDINELSKRNVEHDIGFAIEPSTSLNRDLCISNKLLDYLRSGLMVIATKTQGHMFVANNCNESIRLYKSGDVSELTTILKEILENRELIQNFKDMNLNLAKEKFNWNSSSLIWLESVKKTLND